MVSAVYPDPAALGLGGHDTAGVAADETVLAAERIDSAGTTPVILVLREFDGLRLVDVATPAGGTWNPVTGEEPRRSEDYHRNPLLYAPPSLDADEAEQAAAHLEKLADLAATGPAPAAPGRHGRAAQRAQHLLDVGEAKPDDPLGIGEHDLPITIAELIALLNAADPAGQASPRRKVVAETCAATGGDTGVLWLDLPPLPGRTRLVTVTGIEGDTSDPDDDAERPYAAAYAPDGARHLASRLRAFAAAARPVTPRPAVDAAAVLAQLRATTSVRAGEQLLTGLSLAELRAVARAAGLRSTGRTRADKIQELVTATISGPGALRRAQGR